MQLILPKTQAPWQLEIRNPTIEILNTELILFIGFALHNQICRSIFTSSKGIILLPLLTRLTYFRHHTERYWGVQRS